MASTEATAVQMAQAVPVFPPRPDAIATLLTTNDFLPGVQTLLYSVKKVLPKNIKYPPELVVFVTPNISQQTREALCPTFAQRIIEVDPISFPDESVENKQVVSSHVPSLDKHGGLTKLHIFRFTNYDTMIYLDADCLVVKDISHLLDLGKVYVESDALVAAAPDIFPPDKFNAGVMVIRPSQKVFENMMAQRALLATYDGGDTGFLNSFYSDWFTSMPPMARLKFGYNAQRFMYHCTYVKQPNYWDLAVAPDLYVIHYASSPKPWQVAAAAGDDEENHNKELPRDVLSAHLGQDDMEQIQKATKTNDLEALWRSYYQRSLNFALKEKQKMEPTRVVRPAPRSKAPVSQKDLHKLVSKRYNQLRKEGKDTKEAMAMARAEYGLDQEEVSPAEKVAAMFGVSLE